MEWQSNVKQKLDKKKVQIDKNQMLDCIFSPDIKEVKTDFKGSQN